MSFIVAIDGPAGSGKGTVTELVCKKLNFVNICTGAAYRSVALASIENNINENEKNKIIELLDEIKIEFKKKGFEDVIYLNGRDVSKRIRQKDVTSIVSKVSSIKEVRIKLNDIFRKIAEGKNVVMEGRDIGTCVFPNADVKIYLDASIEERANRRVKQNKELGINIPYEEIKNDIIKRDNQDKEKEIGALRKADDSIYIDSSNLEIEEVTNKVIEIIESKKKQKE